MNQTQYLTRLLEKYDMTNCKPRTTPCEMKLNFGSDTTCQCSIKYREIIGNLIYAMTCTRPDLCWIITMLSQHLERHSVEHCITLKHVLRYVKGTLHYELCFRKCETGLQLAGFSDASWGSSDDRKSVTGYCFHLNQFGPLVSWKSKKQPTVALSSCEAEYMALATAVQERLFLSQLLHDMHENCHDQPVTIYEDNQGAIALVENPVHHQRSKHIDIKYHFIRTECNRGKINVVYVPSSDMVADILTKSASKDKLRQFTSVLFGQ